MDLENGVEVEFLCAISNNDEHNAFGFVLHRDDKNISEENFNLLCEFIMRMYDKQLTVIEVEKNQNKLSIVLKKDENVNNIDRLQSRLKAGLAQYMTLQQTLKEKELQCSLLKEEIEKEKQGNKDNAEKLQKVDEENHKLKEKITVMETEKASRENELEDLRKKLLSSKIMQKYLPPLEEPKVNETGVSEKQNNEETQKTSDDAPCAKQEEEHANVPAEAPADSSKKAPAEAQVDKSIDRAC